MVKKKRIPDEAFDKAWSLFPPTWSSPVKKADEKLKLIERTAAYRRLAERFIETERKRLGITKKQIRAQELNLMGRFKWGMRDILTHYYTLRKKPSVNPDCPRPDSNKEMREIRKHLDSLKTKGLISEEDIQHVTDILSTAVSKSPYMLAWHIYDRKQEKPSHRPRDNAFENLVWNLALSHVPRFEELTFRSLEDNEILRRASGSKITWASIEQIVREIEPGKHVNKENLKKRYDTYKKFVLEKGEIDPLA
ncbi:MAG: hypothetical protein M0Z48_01560 [Nitrospiraceae bacterium]|nr:hypothetical protein [Nitrospiraceae bacterium]